MSRIETLFVGGVETVGHPHAVNKLDQQWMTAAYKKAMPIPVFLTKSGLEGDDVGDKKHHGGPEKHYLRIVSFIMINGQKNIQMQNSKPGQMVKMYLSQIWMKRLYVSEIFIESVKR